MLCISSSSRYDRTHAVAQIDRLSSLMQSHDNCSRVCNGVSSCRFQRKAQKTMAALLTNSHPQELPI